MTELYALDPDAEQRLWRWLASMDLVSTFRVMRGPLPHPLQLSVLEPRRLGTTVVDALWLRFLDVAAALEARRYAGEGQLVLELTDTMFPANAGRWEIAADADGQATVSRTSAEPDVALDVATLASTYLGLMRFGDLARAGRVRECRDGALATADRLFATSVSPFCNTPF